VVEVAGRNGNQRRRALLEQCESSIGGARVDDDDLAREIGVLAIDGLERLTQTVAAVSGEKDDRDERLAHDAAACARAATER
jgi:hypothetical protein